MSGAFKWHKMGTLTSNGLIKVSNDILAVNMFSSTVPKMKFSIKDYFSKFYRIWKLETADLDTLTEEIFNGKLHFLYSASEQIRDCRMKLIVKITIISNLDVLKRYSCCVSSQGNYSKAICPMVIAIFFY